MRDRPRLLNEELVLPTGYAPEAIADGALDLLSKLLRVCAAPSHGLFSEGSMERLDGSPIERLLVTDSIETQPVTLSPKVAPLFGEAIRRIHDRESVSGLAPP